MNIHSLLKAKVSIRSPSVELGERPLENPVLVGARVEGGIVILEIEERPDAE